MDFGFVIADILSSAGTTMSGLSAYINTVLGVGLGIWAFNKFRKGA